MKPVNDTSFFQEIPLLLQNIGGITFSSKHSRLNGMKFFDDFYCFSVPNNKTIVCDSILFLGYGIDNEKYSDYKDIDVTGKVLLVFHGEPTNKKGISYITGTKDKSEWTNNKKKKSEIARNKGEYLTFIFAVYQGKRLHLLHYQRLVKPYHFLGLYPPV